MTPVLAGFDVQKTRLGWALLNAETGEPLAAGTELLDVKNGGWLHQQIGEALRRLPLYDGEIEAVVREEPTTRFVSQAKIAGAVCALVDAEVRRRWPHAALWTLMPAEWKRLAGLPGNASKADIRAWAKLHIGMTHNMDAWDVMFGAIDQDAADALGVALAGWRQWTESERTAA